MFYFSYTFIVFTNNTCKHDKLHGVGTTGYDIFIEVSFFANSESYLAMNIDITQILTQSMVIADLKQKSNSYINIIVLRGMQSLIKQDYNIIIMYNIKS